MREHIYNDIKFYSGQTAIENWELLDISKSINEDFIWFHLNSFPSPYVIMYSTLDDLKNIYDKAEIQKFLNYGATICKENSKYKFLNDLKILYTSLKKIKKGNKVGEVLVSGKRNTIKF